MMNAEDFMRRHSLTDQLLDEMAAPYERGDYELSEGQIFSGSHIDAAGTKRVTVVYSASATQKVAALAALKDFAPRIFIVMPFMSI